MIILVVEDDAISALSVMDELLLAGHEVLGPVWTASTAYTLANSRHPALALIDIDLEHKGEGLEIAECLRRQGISSIFVTAQVDLARRHAGSALGLLSKPYQPQDLAAVVAIAAQMIKGGKPPPPTVPSGLELFLH